MIPSLLHAVKSARRTASSLGNPPTPFQPASWSAAPTFVPGAPAPVPAFGATSVVLASESRIHRPVPGASSVASTPPLSFVPVP